MNGSCWKDVARVCETRVKSVEMRNEMKKKMELRMKKFTFSWRNGLVVSEQETKIELELNLGFDFFNGCSFHFFFDFLDF